MNIAQIAPLWYPVSETTPGGAEHIAGRLSKELKKRGHKVCLFCSGDSHCLGSGDLVCLPKSIHSRAGNITSYRRMLDKAFKKIFKNLKGYDAVHFHDCGLELDHILQHCLQDINNIVITIHHSATWGAVNRLAKDNHGFKVVFISRRQQSLFKKIPGARVIYNGIELDKIGYNSKPKDYLLFAGRINKDKGADIACRIALQKNIKLYIIGGISPSNREFYNRKVKPLIGRSGGLIEYLGVKPHKDVLRYMRGAKALLMPIRWQEPFGLVMAEALACGTPVIAFNKGAAPEIVADGKTGYIVRSQKEMAERIDDISKIKRIDCRKRAERYFSFRRMVDEYEKLYKQI